MVRRTSYRKRLRRRKLLLKGLAVVTAATVVIAGFSHLKNKFSSKQPVYGPEISKELDTTEEVLEETMSVEEPDITYGYGTYIGDTFPEEVPAKEETLEAEENVVEEETVPSINQEEQNVAAEQNRIRNIEAQIIDATFASNLNMNLVDTIEAAVVMSDCFHASGVEGNTKCTLETILNTNTDAYYYSCYLAQTPEEFAQENNAIMGAIDAQTFLYTHTMAGTLFDIVSSNVEKRVQEEGYLITGMTKTVVEDGEVVTLVTTDLGIVKVHVTGEVLTSIMNQSQVLEQDYQEAFAYMKGEAATHASISYEGLDSSNNYSLYTVSENKEVKEHLKEAIAVSKSMLEQEVSMELSEPTMDSLTATEQEVARLNNLPSNVNVYAYTLSMALQNAQTLTK